MKYKLKKQINNFITKDIIEDCLSESFEKVTVKKKQALLKRMF